MLPQKNAAGMFRWKSTTMLLVDTFVEVFSDSKCTELRHLSVQCTLNPRKPR